MLYIMISMSAQYVRLIVYVVLGDESTLELGKCLPDQLSHPNTNGECARYEITIAHDKEM